jgi:hypothetical protein
VLGHGNLNTTRIYTLISSEEQAKPLTGWDLFSEKIEAAFVKVKVHRCRFLMG